MATEKRSLTVVWNNVRKMRSRERQSEIMDWIERSNCDCQKKKYLIKFRCCLCGGRYELGNMGQLI